MLTRQCIKIVLLLLKVTVPGPDKGTISVAAVTGSAHRFRQPSAGTPVYWALGSLRLFEFQCKARGKSLAEKM